MATENGDDELNLALEALTASIPIVTSTKVASAKAGKYIIAHIDCGCRRSEQRQMSQSTTTLLECVHSLGVLIEEKHAKCIAERAVSSAAAAAAAAQKESLAGTFLSTMMEAAAARATSARQSAELLAAQELVKSSKLVATAAEERAEAARRAEAEAAAIFVAPRNAAEKEAAELAVAADAARHALSELHGDEKRARVEGAGAEHCAEPNEEARRWESHWCDGCFRGRAPGDGLTPNYCCEECDGPEPQWTEHEIDRTDAAGIANRRVLAQTAGHRRAALLAGAGGVGKFIIVQARER